MISPFILYCARFFLVWKPSFTCLMQLLPISKTYSHRLKLFFFIHTWIKLSPSFSSDFCVTPCRLGYTDLTVHAHLCSLLQFICIFVHLDEPYQTSVGWTVQLYCGTQRIHNCYNCHHGITLLAIAVLFPHGLYW